MLLDIHSDFINEITEKTKLSENDGEPCGEKLKAIFKTFMKAIFENKLSFKVLLEQETFLPPAAKKEVNKNIHFLKEGIKRIIEEGIKRGEIRNLDSKMATFCVFALCNYTLRWVDPEGPYSYKELGEICFEIFFRGVVNVKNESMDK